MIYELRIYECFAGKLDNLNAIEQLSEDVLDILTLCGMKFYQKGKRKHDN